MFWRCCQSTVSYSHPLCQTPITPLWAFARISADWEEGSGNSPGPGGAAGAGSRHRQRSHLPGAAYCCKWARGERKTVTKNRYGPAAFAPWKIPVQGGNSRLQFLPACPTLPRTLPPKLIPSSPALPLSLSWKQWPGTNTQPALVFGGAWGLMEVIL